MSNEKHSDSWIDKLDLLEGVPGEAPFDRTAAWDRLHQRLDKKEAKKSTIWYWAAACLFVACIVLVLPAKRQKAHLQPPVSRIQIKESPGKEGPPVVHSPVTSATADTAVEKKVVAPAKIGRSKSISDVAVIVPPVIKIVPHADTILAETTAVAAAPRKMRVVHINDVGGDVIGNAYVYPEHKQFKISISGPAGFASQVVADKATKTIHSPKN